MAVAAETSPNFSPGINPELADERVLTEVDHIIRGLRPDGSVAPEVITDVKPNLNTAIYEMSLPLGVTTTAQRVERHIDPSGVRRQMIVWMGKNIVDNAVNGSKFYGYEEGRKRGLVEVNEAYYSQDATRPGIAHAMISPKMPLFDGAAHIAEAEHVHIDDSIRVSYAITNSRGEVTARKLQSLLVRDVPLEAWVAMLRDPNNIFGKAFNIKNEQSALSVMELFSQLEISDESIPEGPITLVAAVQKYIKDNDSYDSVGRQLEGFRKDQEVYQAQAELTAHDWLQFEIELAKSLKGGIANNKIQGFIASLQDHWDVGALTELANSHLGNNQYIMTRKLAAMLERAKRKLLCDQAAIATGNEYALTQLQPARAGQLKDRINSLQIMYMNRMISEQEYAREQAALHREIASENIKSGGGGCPGDVNVNFRSSDGTTLPDGTSTANQGSDWENGKRKWKMGKCQVKACPSPKPTEVGPCSVCKRCQGVFDRGGDPTKPGLVASLLGDYIKPVGNELDKSYSEKNLSKQGPNHSSVKQETTASDQLLHEAIAGIDVVTIEAEEKRRRTKKPAQYAVHQSTQLVGV